MPRYKLTIAYDGTNYHGWQIQPNGITVQEVLMEKSVIILRQPVKIIGSGRTDAGVHAHGQVAHFAINEEIDQNKYFGSINALIPKDIRILKIESASDDFHAQYSAKGKTYHYHLWLDRVQDPFKRLYSLHVLEKLDLNLLVQASKIFLGTHDFTSFANEAHTGCAAYDAIRTIKRLDFIPQDGGLRMEIEADGFLYKMVRNIMGTLLDVARGKMQMEEISELFEKQDRRLAGKAAPPHGLFLYQVDY